MITKFKCIQAGAGSAQPGKNSSFIKTMRQDDKMSFKLEALMTTLC